MAERMLLRVSEVMELTGLGRTKVYALIQSGVVPYVRVGRVIRVPLWELEQWINDTVQRGSGRFRDMSVLDVRKPVSKTRPRSATK